MTLNAGFMAAAAATAVFVGLLPTLLLLSFLLSSLLLSFVIAVDAVVVIAFVHAASAIFSDRNSRFDCRCCHCLLLLRQ